jgi:amidophosphoribosyltransferase
VRGTTSLKIVQMMREAGAKEVHMRIASPPTDTAASTASTRPNVKSCSPPHDMEEMCDFIQADSLAFVTIDGLYRGQWGEAQRNVEACPLLRRLLHRRLSPTRLTDYCARRRC